MHARTCLHKIYVSIDKLPTLANLVHLKYKEDDGMVKRLRIITEASHKWKNIASLISDSITISAVELQYRSDPEDCLRRILYDYFIEQKPEDYSQDWRGLIELLEDADLTALAERVKHALLCTGIYM